MQLVHAGRIGHPLNYEGNEPIVAPSAIQANGVIRIPGGVHAPMPVPEALSSEGAKEKARCVAR